MCDLQLMPVHWNTSIYIAPFKHDVTITGLAGYVFDGLVVMISACHQRLIASFAGERGVY